MDLALCFKFYPARFLEETIGISITTENLIDTQRDNPNTQQISRKAPNVRNPIAQCETTQQNVIRYTTKNCAQYAAKVEIHNK